MSATNRGGERREADFYPTPAWCVHRLLEAVALPFGHWLEPCAGGDAIRRAVSSYRDFPPYSMVWTTLDIRPEANADITADFTWMGCPELGDKRFDVCITNPPYNLAEEFVRGALARCDITVMLLRLNWLASEQRADFIRAHTPSVYVLPNRPSFTGEGTDATDYAWMVWGLHDTPTIKVLRSTPLEVRSMGDE